MYNKYIVFNYVKLCLFLKKHYASVCANLENIRQSGNREAIEVFEAKKAILNYINERIKF